MNINKKRELAQFLGMLLGDGGISIHKSPGKRGKDYELYFVQKTLEPVKLFKKLLQNIFKVEGKIERRKDGMFRLRIRSNKKLVEFLRNNMKKFLEMIKNDLELSREFLKAFYGCEGSFHFGKKSLYIEIANKNKEIMKIVENTLQQLKINYITYERNGVYYVRILRVSDIKKFIREIGTLNVFRISRGMFKGKKKSDIFDLFMNSRTHSANCPSSQPSGLGVRLLLETAEVEPRVREGG